MFAAIFCLALIGGVAAAFAAMSNTQSGTFAVHSDLPVALAWTTDPSETGYLAYGVTCTGQLEYVNNYDIIISPVYLQVKVTMPNIAGTYTDFLININGTNIPLGWGAKVGSSYTQNILCFAGDTISGLESGYLTFSFTAIDDGTPITGDYTVDIFLFGEFA